MADSIRNFFSDEALIELVSRSVKFWNDGDMESLSQRFREDAVLSSPFLNEHKYLVGRQEIIEHLNWMKDEYPSSRIVDVFTDHTVYALLVADEASSYFTYIVEPDLTANLIRRLTICRSLMKSLRI
ncbi:hypothetical protein PY365_22070 [Roseiarcaceae bacterium H3SJ34-1]|uniref:hypothetical protein n=1 Tax=Terripilifer ovatus TaxID=3032367 RepID=UPI003AB9480C|nr:hypothetical protein [Roseiarcaceae bacterium H3SJ34-1]